MNDTATMILDKVRSGSVFHGFTQKEVAGLLDSLPSYDKEALIEPLILALTCGNPSERANAMHVLRMLGAHAKPATAQMILYKVRVEGNMCVHESWRSDLAKVLDTMPPEGEKALIEPLISLVRSGDFTERLSAVRVLDSLGKIAQPAVPAMIEGMSSYPYKSYANKYVEFVIKALLNIVGDAETVSELVKVLPQLDPSKDYIVQSKILDWLADRGTSALPYIIPYLAQSTSSNALKKIGAAGVPAVVEAAQRANARETAGRSVCFSAGRLLSSFGDEGAQSVLGALETCEKESRLPMLITFKSLERSAASSVKAAPVILRILLEEENPECIEASAWALIHLGSSAGCDVCESFAIARRDLYPKLLVILTHLGYSAIPMLTTYLSHANATVQAHAAIAILKITSSDDGDAVQILVSLLQGEDEQVRLTVLEALAYAREEAYPGDRPLQLVPALVAPCFESDTPIRRQAERPGDLGQRTAVAIEQLMKAVSGEKCDTSWQSGHGENAGRIRQWTRWRPAPGVPFMPSYSLIKETLEHQFPYGMVKSWNDSPSQKVKIDVDAEPMKTGMNAFAGQPDFLKRHLLLAVSISGYPLISPQGPPSSNRYCAYAYDGTRMFLLTGPCATKHLSEIFRAEAIQPHLVDPVELAFFLCQILLPMGVSGYSPRGHVVIDPSDDRNQKFGVENDSRVTRPCVEQCEDQGWAVHFWTMYLQGGCTQTVPTLHEHTIKLSAQFDISHEELNAETRGELS